MTLELTVPTKVPSSTDELRHMEAAHQVGGCVPLVWIAGARLLLPLPLPSAGAAQL